MKLRCLLVLIIPLIFSAESALAIPTGAVLKDAESVDCFENLLARHLESPNTRLEDWKSLPAKLKIINSGTLLVRVDLSSHPSSLSELANLVSPLDGLKILEGRTHNFANKFASKTDLVFVANGPRAALGLLNDRVAASGFSASYQFFNFSATAATEVFPRLIIAVDEKYDDREVDEAEKQIAGQLKSQRGFAIYDISEGRMIFFYPRSALVPSIDSEFLSTLKIKTSWMRRDPLRWTRWILDKSATFVKKTAILSGDWVILSPAAYESIYDIARLAYAELPQIEGIDVALQEATRACFSQTCEVSPQAVVTAAKATDEEEATANDQDILSHASRRVIFNFLKTYRSGPGLSEPHGLERALIKFAQTADNPRRAEKYKKEIRDLGISAYEYQLLRDLDAATAQKRFADAWRAALRLRQNEYAQKPFSFSNVVKAIRELEEGST